MDPNGHQPGIVKLLGLWTLFDEQIRAQREKRNQISFDGRHLKWGKTELAYYEAHVCRRRAGRERMGLRDDVEKGRAGLRDWCALGMEGEVKE